MRQASYFKALKLHVQYTFIPRLTGEATLPGLEIGIAAFAKASSMDLHKQAPSTEGNWSPSKATSLGTTGKGSFTIIHQF